MHEEHKYDDLFNPDKVPERFDPELKMPGEMSEMQLFKLARDKEIFKTYDIPADSQPKISERTIAKSIERIKIFAESNPKFKQVVENFTNGDENKYTELTENLRTDGRLRLEVGQLITDNINKLAGQNLLPHRVQINDDKNPRLNRGPKIRDLRSQDYSALLAMSMLDGSFDDQYAGDGQIEVSPQTGEVINGQHRAAAQDAIGDRRYMPQSINEVAA